MCKCVGGGGAEETSSGTRKVKYSEVNGSTATTQQAFAVTTCLGEDEGCSHQKWGTAQHEQSQAPLNHKANNIAKNEVAYQLD